MTSIPERVDAAISASRGGSGVTVREDPGHLTLAGTLSTAALEAWQTVFDSCPEWMTCECIDVARDTVEPRNVESGGPVRIELRFQPSTSVRAFFSVEGWRSFLWDQDALTTVRKVWLAFDDQPFATRMFEVEPWRSDSLPQSVAGSVRTWPSSGPRRHVRSQSPGFMPPMTIDPWLCTVHPSHAGPAWTEWTAVASEMIARSLANETFSDGGSNHIGLNGQPPRTLMFGRFGPQGAPFDLLQEAARWVYAEAEDVEVRHTFMTAELCREWPLVDFCPGLERRLEPALASARLLYKAHLRTGSRETLKALGDLRKGLADDVQKIMHQARELSNGVWRDVAIAVAVVAFRLSAARASSPGPHFGWVYLAVVLYLAISFWIISSTNGRFLTAMENARNTWRPKLYAFLDDGDYGDLAETPMSEAMRAYRRTLTQTRAVVVLTAMVLGVLALNEFELLPIAQMTAALEQIWSVIADQFAKDAGAAPTGDGNV